MDGRLSGQGASQLQHPVADADMGLDILDGGILFQLAPQGCHMHPQGCHIAFPAAAPDFIGQIGMGQHLSHILGKQAQQLILGRRQLYRGAVQVGATGPIVNQQAAILEEAAENKDNLRADKSYRRNWTLNHVNGKSIASYLVDCITSNCNVPCPWKQ